MRRWAFVGWCLKFSFIFGLVGQVFAQPWPGQKPVVPVANATVPSLSVGAAVHPSVPSFNQSVVSPVSYGPGAVGMSHGPHDGYATFNQSQPQQVFSQGWAGTTPPVDQSHSGDVGFVPKGRVILEGYWFSRTGVGGDHPLILDDVNPIGDALVTSDDLTLDGEVGAQLHMELGSFYMGYMESGRTETRIESSSDPADINWFDSSAAEPDDRYFTIYDSYLRLWDIGIRRQPQVGTDLYVGFAMGRFEEHLDHLSELDPPRGFYSFAKNELYGAHLGVRKQLFVGGNCRVEAMARGGLYFNSMEVNAVALELDESWDDDSVAYSGMGNISLVIPAWPVNFRIGYQLTLLGGVITPQEASRTLDAFIPTAGEIETGEVLYHGLTFGVEKLW